MSTMMKSWFFLDMWNGAVLLFDGLGNNTKIEKAQTFLSDVDRVNKRYGAASWSSNSTEYYSTINNTSSKVDPFGKLSKEIKELTQSIQSLKMIKQDNQPTQYNNDRQVVECWNWVNYGARTERYGYETEKEKRKKEFNLLILQPAHGPLLVDRASNLPWVCERYLSNNGVYDKVIQLFSPFLFNIALKLLLKQDTSFTSHTFQQDNDTDRAIYVRFKCLAYADDD
ncbi:uncharacterized protein BX664DRAFT_317650 [Halteromyces radiatus]|uniref:uncharacterized protein n=1 Tax=Halteromyces radiatus TaxID=101107 RepID=UPI00221F60DC|nr:uncharacterized protein BX664DRAFT_317650 [Halteromyces radiatus]KAI8079741.1 hypothetical protein BX664DRAFT_317650 [Halteromyces radiatus]